MTSTLLNWPRGGPTIQKKHHQQKGVEFFDFQTHQKKPFNSSGLRSLGALRLRKGPFPEVEETLDDETVPLFGRPSQSQRKRLTAMM